MLHKTESQTRVTHDSCFVLSFVFDLSREILFSFDCSISHVVKFYF